jgi:glutathione S-transferase
LTLLTLYHGTRSVCSSTVRVALAEKQLRFESRIVDLYTGEQFAPEYLKLNPMGVVPTLVDEDGPIVESSVIIQYLNDLTNHNRLMPGDSYQRALARRYLLRSLEIHAATNTLTFATAGRLRILRKSEAEREETYRQMPGAAARAKRRDLVEHGIDSGHVEGALDSFARLFADMEVDLQRHATDWLMGGFSLADVGLIAYVDRLDRLGIDGFWTRTHPGVRRWFERFKARPSYAVGIAPFNDLANDPDAYQPRVGRELWPVLEAKLNALRAAPA